MGCGARERPSIDRTLAAVVGGADTRNAGLLDATALEQRCCCELEV